MNDMNGSFSQDLNRLKRMSRCPWWLPTMDQLVDRTDQWCQHPVEPLGARGVATAEWRCDAAWFFADPMVDKVVDETKVISTAGSYQPLDF